MMEAVAAIAIVGMTAVSALEAVGGDMRTAERAKRAIEVEALATSRLEVMNLLTDQELQSLPDSIQDGKFVAPLRYRVSPKDPLIYGVAASTLFAVAVLASLIPALRATHVDPNVALRAD